MYFSFVFFLANDVLLFGKVEVSHIRTIHRVLEDFCGVSGLKINVVKSKAFASWCMDGALKECITSIHFTDKRGFNWILKKII